MTVTNDVCKIHQLMEQYEPPPKPQKWRKPSHWRKPGVKLLKRTKSEECSFYRFSGSGSSESSGGEELFRILGSGSEVMRSGEG